MQLNRFFRDVFSRNTSEQIIEALNKGLSYDFSEMWQNLYTAAIIAGSPELVRACIDKGADPVNADMPTMAEPYPEVATLNIALEHGRADVLEVLIEEGGWP